MKKEIEHMSRVAKDIISLNFNSKMTLRQVENKFFQIMRKHKIKQGTKGRNGVLINNFEWTMCYELFLSRIEDYFRWCQFLADDVPKDLLY